MLETDGEKCVAVTAKIDLMELIRTASGRVPAREWCESEAERMSAKGGRVRVVEQKGKVWVERAASEVVTSEDNRYETKVPSQ